MADVVLLHHVLGLTDGVRQLARRLGGTRHVVHTPDLYGGRVADDIADGFALKQEIGDEALDARRAEALDGLDGEIVYAGISMGVMTAQRLAQTSPAAVGALLIAACIPVTGEWAFGPWPDGLRVQIHGMDDDEFFAHEGDLDAARELVDLAGPATAELFTYRGDGHLFMDSSLADYDPLATSLVVERAQSLLDDVG